MTRVRARSVSWAIETDGDDVNLVLCRIVERPSGVTFLALALALLVMCDLSPVEFLDEVKLGKVERVGDEMGQASRIEARWRPRLF